MELTGTSELLRIIILNGTSHHQTHKAISLQNNTVNVSEFISELAVIINHLRLNEQTRIKWKSKYTY